MSTQVKDTIPVQPIIIRLVRALGIALRGLATLQPLDILTVLQRTTVPALLTDMCLAMNIHSQVLIVPIQGQHHTQPATAIMPLLAITPLHLTTAQVMAPRPAIIHQATQAPRLIPAALTMEPQGIPIQAMDIVPLPAITLLLQATPIALAIIALQATIPQAITPLPAIIHRPQATLTVQAMGIIALQVIPIHQLALTSPQDIMLLLATIPQLQCPHLALVPAMAITALQAITHRLRTTRTPQATDTILLLLMCLQPALTATLLRALQAQPPAIHIATATERRSLKRTVTN